MTKHTIGLNISKAHLDIFRLEDGAAHRFDNSAAEFRALTKWPNTVPVARIVFEPTGPHHKAFEAKLGGVFPLVKVNPLQARQFAEAQSTRAKTDVVDAPMLARMGAAFNLKAKAPCFEGSIVPRDLKVARAGMIKDRTRLRNRAHTFGVQAVEHHRRKVSFFSMIELVNALEKEKAMGKTGQLAEGLTKLDLHPQGIDPTDQFLIFVHP